MRLTLLTTVLLACMTAFVAASPVPAPVQVEARAQELLPREVVVARDPQDEYIICGKYNCI